jgi:hypothetical protein
MLNRVAAIRDTEPKLENKVFEKQGTKEVSLDHCKILHRPIANRELNPFR